MGILHVLVFPGKAKKTCNDSFVSDTAGCTNQPRKGFLAIMKLTEARGVLFQAIATGTEWDRFFSW